MRGSKRPSGICEREIDALDGQKPYGVEYEDVLDYYGQSIDLGEAWPTKPPQEVPFALNLDGSDGPVGSGGTDTIFKRQRLLGRWTTPDYADRLGSRPWSRRDPLEREEVDAILAKKDLDQFDDDEIVSTVERRGMIIGFKKDGSSCVLKNGRCV